MPNLIVTRSDASVSSFSRLTLPMLQRYAKKCNADFKILEKRIPDIHYHHSIFNLYNLLDKYDRILCIDSDTIIKKSCPSLFDIVPIEKIGTIFEDKGSRKENRLSRLQNIQNVKGNVGLTCGYINTGVFIVSKCHKEVFSLNSSIIPFSGKNDLWTDHGFDDVELSWRIRFLKFEIHELSPIYNFISMFEENWCGMTRNDAQIIHYAGTGFYPSIIREMQIAQDYYILDRYNMVI